MSLEGAGGVRFWGFSPAVDLTAEAPPPADGAEGAEPEPLRALLVAVSDVRHLLATVAAAARRAHEGGTSARALEFAVYEREPEVLARHLLLLAIALDFELPRRERAEVLLEVWANAQLREKTATYVAVKAVEIGRALAHDEGPLAPLLDTSSLKSRERDALEQVLRTWGPEVEFDIVRLRDERLRRFFGQRYDSRKNVLEWDYTMELLEIASIVHKIHYREWRMTGLCFEVRDSTYHTPNRTLSSMAYGRQAGRSVMRRGFWGDVANGPWVATGVTCDDERLTNKRNDQHHKSSCDIAYYNTLGYLSSMETGASFALKQEDMADFEYGGSVAGGGLSKGFLNPGGGKSGLGAVAEEDGEGGAAVEDITDLDPAAEEAKRAKEAADAKRVAEARAKVVAQKMAKLPTFKLKLLGGDWLDVQKKPRHQKAFDVAVVGTHFAFIMGSERLNGLLRPKAHVLLETAKFLTEVRKSNRTEYCTKLLGVAARLGWTLRGEQETRDPDGCKDAFVRFAFDEASWEERAAAVRKKLEASQPGGASEEVPTLSSEGAGGGERDEGAEGEGAAAKAAGASRVDPSQVGMLKIADGADGEEGAGGAEGAPAAAPLPEVKLTSGSAAALSAGGNGKVCAITGKPAKYRDPISGLPYADLEAFRELRKQYPDPKAAEKEAAAAAAKAAAEAAKTAKEVAAKENDAGGEGGGGGEEEESDGVIRAPVPSERPIQLSSNFARRVNKVA